MNTGAILILLFFICYPILDARRDSLVLKTGEVNHFWNALNYCVLLAFSIIGIFFIRIPMEKSWEIEEFLQMIFSGLILRWIIFDISYNLFSNRRVFQQGSTAFLDKIPSWISLVLKGVGLFFAILFTLQWLLR